MGDSEIKNLLERANAQVHIDEARKKKAHQAMMMEMEKQKINKQRIEMRMSFKNILLQQFYYMDKLFFYIYGGLICLGIIFIAVLQYTGVSQNEIITVCMAGAGILSITSIGVIDKMFFGKMAELGATCYFDTRMCAAAGLMVIGSVNFTVIMLLALYSGNTWEVSNLQTVIYILTAYLVSGSLDFGILLFKTGEKASVAMAAGILICSGVCIVVSNIPGALFSASISIWAGVCAVAGGLTFVQVKRLFSAGEMVFEEA